MECTLTVCALFHPGAGERGGSNTSNVHRALGRDFTESHADERERGSAAHTGWWRNASRSPKAHGNSFTTGATPRRGDQSLRRGREGPGNPTEQKPPPENPNAQHQQENTRSTNHSPEVQVSELVVKGSRRRPRHLSSHALGDREAKTRRSVGGERPVERGRRQNSMDECAHCSGTCTAHEPPPPVPGSGAG